MATLARPRSIGRLLVAAVLAAGCASGAPASPAGSSDAGLADGLAAAVVARLAAEPFVAHVEQTASASSTLGSTTAEVKVSMSADLSGADASFEIFSEGAQELDASMVILDGTAYLSLAGGEWQTVPASVVESSLKGMHANIRLVARPEDLAYIGPETIDGADLHHLEAVVEIPYEPAAGGTGHYDAFDIWVTADGTPVLVRSAFTATAPGGVTASGTTEIRFSRFGGPIDIVAPSVAPSSAP